MEIKANQMRTKAIYSELATASESATVTCTLAETQRQTEGWGKLYSRKKEDSNDALAGGC